MKTPLEKLSFHRIGKGKYTPLWNLLDALFNHDDKRLGAILDTGADINMADDRGFTALHYAVDYGDLEAVRMLLQRNANKYARCKTNSTPFHHSIIFGKHEMVQCFIDKGTELFIDPTEDIRTDASLMWKLMLSGKVNAAIGFLKDGIKPIKSDLYDDTMLTHAAALGYSSIVEELLAIGLDAKHVSRQQYCVFDVAAMNNHVDCMELLFQAGVDINHVGGSGMTALMYAAHLASVDSTLWLLEHGANTSQISANGMNAIDWAIYGSVYKHGNHELVKLLDAKGLKPLHFDINKKRK